MHRLETNKLRNVAKFFGQLFYCDALPWTGMSCIHLNEEETNSSRLIEYFTHPPPLSLWSSQISVELYVVASIVYTCISQSFYEHWLFAFSTYKPVRLTVPPPPECLVLCIYGPAMVDCSLSLSLSPSLHSRIFVKILFQELAEFMGLLKLNERLRDP